MIGSAIDQKRPLATLPLVFLDVETTGLSAWTGHRVCELAMVRSLGKREVDRLDSLVHPRRGIPADARAVNGISDEMVAKSPPFESLAARAASLLDGAVVVAHNAPFDLSFITREFELAGLRIPTSPTIDTLALARHRYPARPNSLGALAKRLGVRVPSHRAMADVLTTREVFWRLTEQMAGRAATLGDVMGLQGFQAPDADDIAPQSPADEARPVDIARSLEGSADLVSALRAGARLRVVYRGSSGRTTERTIEPMAVVDQGADVVVLAYCHLRRAERTFSVSRIVSWVADAGEQTTGSLLGSD
jgi:DNA polymerase-3 subunit epsilon